MNKNILKTLYTVMAVTGIFFITAVFANAAMYGDIDGEKGISAADARMILRASVGLETLTEEQLIFADIDENGTVSAADARFALRMSVGLDEAKHFYDKKLTKEPSCTEAGEYEYSCTECDDKYTVPVDALGHDYPDPEILVQVTCDSDGIEKYTCERCGFSEEITVVGGHVWSPEKASCTEDQYCIRGNHTGDLKYGHTTDWGKCGNCKVFVTDKNKDAAAAVKENYDKGLTDVEKAYDYIQESYGAYSWLQNYVSKAKPYYLSAKEYYQAAYDACGDIEELKSIKADIGKILNNLDGILAQIDVIMAYGYIGNEDVYFTLVGPIDDLNYMNKDNIIDTNSALKNKIVW